MKNNETLLSLILGSLGVIAWLFPNIDFAIKLYITGIAIVSILFIIFKDKLSYFFRKNWQLLISLALIGTFYLLFKNAYPELLLPSIIILLTCVSVTLLLIFKYRQPYIYKTKVLIRKVIMDSSWHLNHWGSNCARLEGNKIIFTGTLAPEGSDGCHIDLLNSLEIGATYEIACDIKSDNGTTAKFQLWCHDKVVDPNGVSVSTPFKTPSSKGEIVSLLFKAEFNESIRIHIQCSAGTGQIEVTEIRIYKLNV